MSYNLQNHCCRVLFFNLCSGKNDIWLYSHAEYTAIMINIRIKTIFQMICLLTGIILFTRWSSYSEWSKTCTGGGRSIVMLLTRRIDLVLLLQKLSAHQRNEHTFFLLLATFFLAFLSRSLMTTQYFSSHDQQWKMRTGQKGKQRREPCYATDTLVKRP